MFIVALWLALIAVFVVYSIGLFLMGMKYRDKVIAEEKQLKLNLSRDVKKL